jgi:uncharacterized protein (DUF2147 family)
MKFEILVQEEQILSEAAGLMKAAASALGKGGGLTKLVGGKGGKLQNMIKPFMNKLKGDTMSAIPKFRNAAKDIMMGKKVNMDGKWAEQIATVIKNISDDKTKKKFIQILNTPDDPMKTYVSGFLANKMKKGVS